MIIVIDAVDIAVEFYNVSNFWPFFPTCCLFSHCFTSTYKDMLLRILVHTFQIHSMSDHQDEFYRDWYLLFTVHTCTFQIHSMEKEGRDFIERQITQLKTQLEAMTDRCHQTQLQLEVNKSEFKNLKVRIDLRSLLLVLSITAY